MRGSFLLAVAVLLLMWSGASADVVLPSIFSDHMVVQQKTPFKVFGQDKPGQKITATFKDQTATTTAGHDGKWTLTIAPPPAGGPYGWSVSGSSEKQFSDVLVGEVWLCSGQSNMGVVVQNAANGAQEAAAAKYPAIRFFAVPNTFAKTPQDDVPAKWVACSPGTALWSSAVAYFFGRQIHQDLGVPVGLITSSVGGTMAEAWTPGEELLALPGMKQAVAAQAQRREQETQKYGEAMGAWLEAVGIRTDAGEKQKAGWAEINFDEAGWKTMPFPTYWQSIGTPGNGIVWVRKTIDLPDAAGQAGTLELGTLDNADVTFVNGVQVGAVDARTPYAHTIRRHYTIPPRLLVKGRNVVAIRIVDIGGLGGFGGPVEAMKLTVGDKTIPLGGEWRFCFERQITIPADKPVPGDPPNDPQSAELYNGMINPFAGYPIAGAIWYQGEANVGNPAGYQQVLPTMIKAWRSRWGNEFPFLLVQLAGYQEDSGRPADSSGWAIFRDAQRQIAIDTPRCGMALAIDIGDAKNIHPANKQDVGKRLALQAMKLAYGRDVVASGPALKTAKADGARVVLTFDNPGGGLVARNNDLSKNFALQDKNGTWAWADAKIEADRIILSSPDVKQPAMVRYAWQNMPPASLYNKASLPAVPFEVKVE